MFAQIAGVTGVPGFDVPSQASSAAPQLYGSGHQATEEDKQAFAGLMEATQPTSGSAPVHAAHGPSALSGLEKFATMQNLAMQDEFQSMRDLATASPHLSMAEATLYGVEMNMKMAVTDAHFKVATGVSKSTGKGIDTLMRNQ